MGILVFYEGDGRIAGDLPVDEWRQIRRLLPLAVELINTEMLKPRTLPMAEKLPKKPIHVEKLIRDDSKKTEEINLLDMREWDRLLAWWSCLSDSVNAMRFYQPMLEVLKAQTRHPDQPGT